MGVFFSYFILRNDLSDIRQPRQQCFGPDFMYVFLILTIRNRPVHSVAAQQCVHVVCVSLFKVTSLI